MSEPNLYQVVLTSTSEEVIQLKASSKEEAEEQVLEGNFNDEEVVYNINYNWKVIGTKEVLNEKV